MGERPSGPTALEFFDLLMAFAVCSSVMLMGLSLVGFLMVRRVFLKPLEGLRVVLGVYWRLRWFEIFLGLLWCLPLKEILWLSSCLGPLFSCLMVDHSLLDPGGQFVRCSSHFFFLFSLMLVLIWWLRSCMLGSAGFCSRRESRSSISFAVVVVSFGVVPF